MKTPIAAAALALLLVACHYDFAAVDPNSLPVDPKLAGRWIQTEQPEGNDVRPVLVVAPSEQGGAMVDLLVEEDGHWYFRAQCLAKDLPGLYQLEFLGASTGERPPGDDRFSIASVEVKDDQLSWRLVDPAKVGEVKDGKALLGRVRSAAADKTDLFDKPTAYTRVPAP